MRSVRAIPAAAALVAALVPLAACDPAADTSAGDGPPSSASPGASAGDGKGGSCPAPAPGHKVIWVHHVEGAMNTVVAKEAKAECRAGSQEGISYHPVGQFGNYRPASGSTVITVISKKESQQKKLTARNGGIAHVKTCADPDGEQFDSGQRKADTSDCWGLNFYDVKIDSENRITRMTEVYSS
ncbi:hypothetical protein [Streptomyces qinglanensis]|uniref:Lipoprotein n=1 Tax=Streptomyces qinglanensis TaxID=943816 RepID=A0A1H9QYJ0_9ACTN|nr:hypothetical protein [Streptomyces qinglanensis]SER65661.1 hypothetical protein SAMN05421870_103206 [Streptomyces qinglanensis]